MSGICGTERRRRSATRAVCDANRGLKAPATGRASLRDGRQGDSETASTGTRDVLRLDGVALHEDFAVTQEVLKKMNCPKMRQWLDSGHDQ